MLILSIVKTSCRNWQPQLKVLAVLVCAIVGARAEVEDYAENNDWSKANNPRLYQQCVMYIKKYDHETLIVASIASNETTPPTLIALAQVDNDTDASRNNSEELLTPIELSLSPAVNNSTESSAMNISTESSSSDCDTFTAEPFTQLSGCFEIGAFGDQNGAYSREACQKQCLMNANCRAIQYGSEECPHECRLFAFKVGEQSPHGECRLIKDNIRQLWDVHELTSRCEHPSTDVDAPCAEEMVPHIPRIGSSFELSGCSDQSEQFESQSSEDFSQAECMRMCLERAWCHSLLVEGRRCTGLSYDVKQLEAHTTLECQGKTKDEVRNAQCRLKRPQKRRTVRSKLFSKRCPTT